MDIIHIYTECSSIGPPGPIGAGAVIVKGAETREISADLGKGSTQQAALRAIWMALNSLVPEEKEHPVVVWTKSKYAAEILNDIWESDANLELIQWVKNRIKEFEDIRIIWDQEPSEHGQQHRERAKQIAWDTIKDRK